jgi:hypothetical protein
MNLNNQLFNLQKTVVDVANTVKKLEKTIEDMNTVSSNNNTSGTEITDLKKETHADISRIRTDVEIMKRSIVDDMRVEMKRQKEITEALLMHEIASMVSKTINSMNVSKSNILSDTSAKPEPVPKPKKVTARVSRTVEKGNSVTLDLSSSSLETTVDATC